MATALATTAAPVQFDFQNNNVEVMTLDTLRRTHKENDIYGNPLKGIYHYEVIERMADICQKHNLNYEVEEIFAAQNKNKAQPGVVVLPQVEQKYGAMAVEAHILRRVYTTIRIKEWETDELTTTLVIAFHQDGIQAAIGPCVRVCHNQCILSPERSVSNYGKDKVTTEELFRSCRRVALELRGTDERGQGTHPPPESESNYPGGDVRLHRIADSIARIA